MLKSLQLKFLETSLIIYSVVAIKRMASLLRRSAEVNDTYCKIGDDGIVVGP